MSLTDTAVRNAKPMDKPFKVTDNPAQVEPSARTSSLTFLDGNGTH